MKVKVTEGYQVAPEDTDKVYGPGETVDVPKAEAQAWINAGYAEEVKAQAKTESKSTEAKTGAKSTKK